MSDGQHGVTREQQVRDMAARLGVADFVYFAAPLSKGHGQREVAGDGLLLVGDRGAVLQVKSRDPSQGVRDSAERARAWIGKNAANAMAQGLGTKREIARRHEIGEPLQVYPVRAADLPADARTRYQCVVSGGTQDWPVIVLLDHPQMPQVDLAFVPGVVCFGFSDWWELQRRLRSTSATIDYVHRILHDGVHVPLWQEAERYAALQTADEQSASTSPTGVPYLAHQIQFDELGTDIYHDVIDKVWPDDGIIPWQSADEYRAIVEFLDAVPPTAQSEVGRWMLRKRTEIAKGRRLSSGLIQLSGGDRLVFACTHFRHWTDEQSWMAEFTGLTVLRHTQALEGGAGEDAKTLGVGALVEDRGEKTGVQYSFVMLIGVEPTVSLRLPKDLRRYFEWTYGIHNLEAGTASIPFVAPDETCPCMSGKEFRLCCGRETGGG
jgi:hypothetical protein